MIDSKLAGTGNSRFLKSVSNFKTLYPTYDDFVAALIAGTLPIDLNGINPDGWTQQGTPLNKANLLSDDVANGLGLVDDATPNGAFNAIISAKGKSNGFATLDSSGKVPSNQLPSMNYIPTSQKGVASGVASLDSDGKVPNGQLNLSSSVTSTSTTTVANSAAVKTAYDKATTTDVITVDKRAECSSAAVTVNSIKAVRAGQMVLVEANIAVKPTSVSTGYRIFFPGLPQTTDKTIALVAFTTITSGNALPYSGPVGKLAISSNNIPGFFVTVESTGSVTTGTSYGLNVTMLYSV